LNGAAIQAGQQHFVKLFYQVNKYRWEIALHLTTELNGRCETYTEAGRPSYQQSSGGASITSTTMWTASPVASHPQYTSSLKS
jgi:hypothetical protein